MFAKELDQPPTPDQKGVTEIELSPGIIKYNDTSLINRAIHPIYLTATASSSISSVCRAFQARLCDEESNARNRVPHYSKNPAWKLIFGHLRSVNDTQYCLCPHARNRRYSLISTGKLKTGIKQSRGRSHLEYYLMLQLCQNSIGEFHFIFILSMMSKDLNFFSRRCCNG